MKQVVVAQWQEDVSWVKDLPAGWRPFIVEKDVTIPNDGGRETSSFLWAMRRIRSNDTVAFVQGNPIEHCPDLLQKLRVVDEFTWLGDTNYVSDGSGGPHDSNVPVKLLYERFCGVFPGEIRFAAGGQFMLPGSFLRAYSDTVLGEMQELACTGRYPWAFERCWEGLFGHPQEGIDSVPMSIPKDPGSAKPKAAAKPAVKKPAAKPVVKPVPKPPTQTARQRFVHWLNWGAQNEPQIHYAEQRPMPIYRQPGFLPLTTDCSGFVTMMAKWADCPDPNGRGFDGEGFTGTLLSHCQHIRAQDAEPGDLIVYGSGSGNHVTAIVQKKGEDFLVVSHGSESGPKLLLNSVEAAYQSPPQTFLRFLAPE